jgi:hypothetical protein
MKCTYYMMKSKKKGMNYGWCRQQLEILGEITTS